MIFIFHLAKFEEENCIFFVHLLSLLSVVNLAIVIGHIHRVIKYIKDGV